jgi:hypothetical protein
MATVFYLIIKNNNIYNEIKKENYNLSMVNKQFRNLFLDNKKYYNNIDYLIYKNKYEYYYIILEIVKIYKKNNLS